MKAQLPNGKYLTFPDGTDFVTVQNAVREAIEKDRLKSMKEQIIRETPADVRALANTMSEISHEMNSSLKAVSSTFNVISEQLGDTIKSLETMNKTVANTINKNSATTGMIADRVEAAVTAMNAPINSLQATVKDMSTLIKDNAKSSSNSMLTLAVNFDKMGIACKELTKAVESIKVRHKMTKRAYKNSDGSWTMETTEPRHH